jgi:hypothetical protein
MGINITNEGIQHLSGDRRRALGETSNTTLPVVRGRSDYPGQAPGYEASLLERDDIMLHHSLSF